MKIALAGFGVAAVCGWLAYQQFQQGEILVGAILGVVAAVGAVVGAAGFYAGDKPNI